jgi:hypothetical protein
MASLLVIGMRLSLRAQQPTSVWNCHLVMMAPADKNRRQNALDAIDLKSSACPTVSLCAPSSSGYVPLEDIR